MVSRAALLMALMLFAPAGAAAFSDEDFCRAMHERAATENRRKPAWIGREIRDDGVTVHCLQKTIEYRRFFNIQPEGVGRDWQQRLAGRWNIEQCQGPMLAAIRNGWQIVELTRFSKVPGHPYGR